MGTYFDPTGLPVTDGENAKASDLNGVINETDAAFQVAEQDIAALAGRGEEWAENDPYDPVTIGKYSAKHYAQLASDWAIGTPTDNDGVPTGDQSAKDEALDAAQSAVDALASETAAGISETNAGTFATTASQHRDKAQDWAEELEDTPVETGPDQFSALHHASKADASAVSAAASLAAIGDSETNAAQSALDAQDAETGAELARDFANKWATQAAGTINDGVNPADYSAYYYAQLAATHEAAVTAEGDTQVARVIAEGDTQYDYINTLDAILKNDGDTGAAGIPAGTTVERPSIPATGNMRFNTTTGDFEGFNGSIWIQPGTGSSVVGTPVGSIIAYLGGYFADGANGTFTNVLGNDAATVNALLNVEGWYVCDGSALNLSSSPIFDGAGRYLPNLTDDRFIMGDTAGGVTGGVNTDDHQHYGPSHSHTGGSHTHSVNPPSTGTTSTALSSNYNGPHTHSYAGRQTSGWDFNSGGSRQVDDMNANSTSGSSGSGWGHTHSVNIGAFNSASAGAVSTTVSGTAETSGRTGNTENRPSFLTCLYIMRVI